MGRMLGIHLGSRSQPRNKGEGFQEKLQRNADANNETKDDAARASYDNQRESDRAEKNAKWEKRMADWEKACEISGKGGSSKDGGKQNKGKTNWVFIPNKIGGNKHKVYPYDFNFFGIWQLERDRPDVQDALILQTPHNFPRTMHTRGP